MWNRSFQEMGLPPGYGFKQLLLSPVANALIVHAQSAGRNWRPERLYFRKLESEQYQPVGQPGDLTSQDHPFVHPAKPLLAYNSMKHRFSVDADGKERHSADWDSLRIYDLKLGVEVDSVNRDSLNVPTGIVRSWISSIVAFSESALFVQAGISRDGSRTDYVIAELDLSGRSLKPIAELPGTFI
jgi:hypothetical protein